MRICCCTGPERPHFRTSRAGPLCPTYVYIFPFIMFFSLKNCLGRIHERFGGKGYFFSWKEPSTVGKEKDWLDGRNYCRQRCMDLVSLESKAENEYIKSRIVQGLFFCLFLFFSILNISILFLYRQNKIHLDFWKIVRLQGLRPSRPEAFKCQWLVLDCRP